MKWIRRILVRIQSGHDSVHRRTDGQGETSIPFQLRWSGDITTTKTPRICIYGYIITKPEIYFSINSVTDNRKAPWHIYQYRCLHIIIANHRQVYIYSLKSVHYDCKTVTSVAPKHRSECIHKFPTATGSEKINIVTPVTTGFMFQPRSLAVQNMNNVC